MISLHVPAHNEPPDMVIDTLRALVRLDYPRYEVILIDDNTDDEACGVRSRPGAGGTASSSRTWRTGPATSPGALNYALQHLTDPDAEIIGVVDSDYQVEPGFLRGCAPLFADPWIGFVQAPQDYRGWRACPLLPAAVLLLQVLLRRLPAVAQRARRRDLRRHHGADPAGRARRARRLGRVVHHRGRRAVAAAAARRLVRHARGPVLAATGIMPLTFEALKGQRYRWCFGGIQILRMHWRSLLPGRSTKENHLSAGQRWAYLSGALQWYGDLLGLLFLVFLLAGAGNLATGGGELFRKLTAFLVATVPVLVLLGLARAEC